MNNITPRRCTIGESNLTNPCTAPGSLEAWAQSLALALTSAGFFCRTDRTVFVPVDKAQSDHPARVNLCQNLLGLVRKHYPNATALDP